MQICKRLAWISFEILKYDQNPEILIEIFKSDQNLEISIEILKSWVKKEDFEILSVILLDCWPLAYGRIALIDWYLLRRGAYNLQWISALRP